MSKSKILFIILILICIIPLGSCTYNDNVEPIVSPEPTIVPTAYVPSPEATPDIYVMFYNDAYLYVQSLDQEKIINYNIDVDNFTLNLSYNITQEEFNAITDASEILEALNLVYDITGIQHFKLTLYVDNLEYGTFDLVA